MKLDMDAVIEEMVDAFARAAGDGSAAMRDYAGQVIADHRAALAELAEARIRGAIDADTLAGELDRERQVLAVEAATLATIGRATAQHAVNAAVDAFADAVAGVIRG